MKTKILTPFVFLFFLGMSNANAQTKKTPGQERHRIAQGVKSGELTKRETRSLANHQKDIHQDKKEARADGVVTEAERKHIKKDERKASRSIYRKKHNNRDRN
ncbi:MAG: hypothetical protein M3Z92_11350 [Bacteroidota bacterium]|nr:hypothetical protein [Bacteroidota bacterium]MDQ6890838.1 hypothetical protein [Bacteroidota bacterium]